VPPGTLQLHVTFVLYKTLNQNNMKSIITCLLLFAAFTFTEKATAQPSNCQAAFTYTLDSTGTIATFTNTSTGNITNVSYSFGDGTASSLFNPVHLYNSPGPHIVCLTVWDSAGTCQSTFCDTVNGGSTTSGCSASFSLQSTGLTVYFYGYLAFGTNAVSYTWDFGDNTSGTGAFPQHIYTASGTYNVCVTVATAGGCIASYCDSVTVTAVTGCNASFNASNNGLLNTVSFTNTSTGNNLVYFWDFGDGTTSTLINPLHTYSGNGTYTVCLTIGDPATGCQDTYCTAVTVGNSVGCNAVFGFQNTGNTYYFYAANAPGLTHNWSLGDGTYDFTANPVHTYSGPGTYIVCHTITDSVTSCTATYCDTVIISQGGNCNVTYTFSTDSTGTIFTFAGSASGTTGGLSWSFGDGTGGTGPSIVHQYTTSGVYIVCLSLLGANGTVLCSWCDSIAVGTPVLCIPVFYSYTDSNVIGNGNVYFGVSNPCGNTQYVWTFGDGTTGSGSTPVHNYADSGWYNVCVTAYTPAGNYTFCDSIYALRLGSTSIAETAASIGLKIAPNPADELAKIQFTLHQQSDVMISLTDIQGKIQSVLYNGVMPAGEVKLNLNTGDLQSGIYLLDMLVNGISIHQRIAVQ
jgi:PKD repeat protein